MDSQTDFSLLFLLSPLTRKQEVCGVMVDLFSLIPPTSSRMALSGKILALP
jgi:hypothetical protein